MKYIYIFLIAIGLSLLNMQVLPAQTKIVIPPPPPPVVLPTPPVVKLIWLDNYTNFIIELTGVSSQFGSFKLFRNDEYVDETLVGRSSVQFTDLEDFGEYKVEGYGMMGQLLYEQPVALHAYPSELRTSDQQWASVRTFTSPQSYSFFDDITYFDGFGQPAQVVACGASPESGENIIQPIQYDEMQRADTKSYLPYSKGRLGLMDENCYSNQQQFYANKFTGEKNFFTTKTYEKSPLSRLLSATNPGAQHSLHPAKLTYELNTDVQDYVFNYTIIDGRLKRTGYYPLRMLFKTTVTDEDGRPQIVFSLPSGLKVLERSISDSSGNSDTYYVYDNHGRIAYVIPAEVSANIALDESLCYVYKYDSDGNMILKQIPGSIEEEYLYDARGRIIYSCSSGQWKYHIYDQQDRMLAWGTTHCFDRANLEEFRRRLLTQTHYLYEEWSFGDILPQPYSPTVFQEAKTQALYKYDKAPILIPQAFKPNIDYKSYPGYASSPDSRIKGLKTYEAIRAIDGTGSSVRTFYYDREARLIQIAERTHDNFSHRISFAYDFNGNVSRQLEEVRGAKIETICTETVYTYNDRGHLEREVTSIKDTNAKVNNVFAYNWRGEVSQSFYEIPSLLKIQEDYTYSLRGELTAITNPYLLTNLYTTYRNATDYSGNILSWNTKYTSQPTPLRYVFTYDSQSQLASAVTNTLSGAYAPREQAADEKMILYDRNRNLFSTTQTGKNREQCDIAFKSLKDMLTTVELKSGNIIKPYSFKYNWYGNMTTYGENATDNSKYLSIQYNFLNLATKISRSEAYQGPEERSVEMSYLSDGTKLAMTYASGKSLRYIGSLVYEKQADGTFRIESVPFSNGRFVASHTSAGTSFDAQRHLTDHLGSVRCIVNSAGLVIEMNDYTPYGERFSVPSYPRSSNRYLFNGKEEVLAGLLDYGARIYDPYTRRWLTQDPLAEMYYGISPYAYCLNNPVNYVDPFGLWPKEPIQIEEVVIYPDPYLRFLSLANVRMLQGTINRYDKRSGGEGQAEPGVGNNGGGSSGGYGGFMGSGGHIGVGGGTAGGQNSSGISLQNLSERDLKHYLTMTDPVVQAVHRGQSNFLKGAAGLSAYILQNAGAVTTVIGYGTAFLGDGGTILAIGGATSYVGNMIQGAIYLEAGNTGQGLYQMGMSTLFFLGPVPLKNYMTTNQYLFMSGYLMPFEYMTGLAGSYANEYD